MSFIIILASHEDFINLATEICNPINEYGIQSPYYIVEVEDR